MPRGQLVNAENRHVGCETTAAAAIGATELQVEWAGYFPDAKGKLKVGDLELKYRGTDEDEPGNAQTTVYLVEELAEAVDEGTPVRLMSGDQVLTYRDAWVQLRGADEPVVVDVPHRLRDDVPPGRENYEDPWDAVISDDLERLIDIPGRERARKIEFEAHDSHTVTHLDKDAGTVTFPLSHRPLPESLVAFWTGEPQRPTEYSIDYAAQTVTWPLDGFEQAGDVLWVHYAYTNGPRQWLLDFAEPGWRYNIVALADAIDYSGESFNDSAWSTGPAPFGDDRGIIGWDPIGTAWPSVAGGSKCWIRRKAFPPAGRTLSGKMRCDDGGAIYWNGAQILEVVNAAGEYEFEIPAGQVLSTNTVALRGRDESNTNSADNSYIDVRLEAS